MKSSMTALQPVITDAVLHGSAAFSGVSINSKNVAPGNLFIALVGERHDGHNFLDEVAAKGAAAVVVQRKPDNLKLPAIVVPDTRVALGEIARYWRGQFTIPVIGVTGSNGKTTVKEMIASILEAEFGKKHFLATCGNLNNNIGVPLTLLRMTGEHRAAVIELGMNHPGEIATLSDIALPTVGLVNNAQREHLEFMATVQAVAMENGAVIRTLPTDGIAVFPADDPYSSLWRAYAKRGRKRKALTFGLSGEATVSCTYQPNDFGSDLTIKISGKEFPVKLAAAGVHNVRNALAAVACALSIGIHRNAIVRGLELFAPVNGRLQRKAARNGAMVIDDTYNANPDSVRAAIDVLMHSASPRILVLGDMGEVGSEGRMFHEEIGAYARGRGIEHLLTLGDLACGSCSAFGIHAKHFDDINALIQTIDALTTSGATVLVKGSRFMKMERVVQHLVGEPLQESH